MSVNTKNILKIPNNISVFYSPEKKLMIIQGPKNKFFLKVGVDIVLKKNNREILVTLKSDTKKQKNYLRKMQGTTVALIKQCIYGTLTAVCVKIMLIGIGYKIFPISDCEDKLFQFRLGFSHSLFFKIPESLKIICFKYTKLFIYGNSYYEVTQAALKIRRKKIPEPYKGKGIRYENEKIVLKSGKKV